MGIGKAGGTDRFLVERPRDGNGYSLPIFFFFLHRRFATLIATAGLPDRPSRASIHIVFDKMVGAPDNLRCD